MTTTVDRPAGSAGGLALVNGRVYTMDARVPVAPALFAWQGRVAHVGGDAEVRALAGQVPGCLTVDLAGGCAVPGFVDSHIHFLSYGLNLGHVALTGVTSLAEVLGRVGRAAERAAPGEWIEGWGWDHSLWPERRFPDRRALDAVAPTVPVALRRKDGHVVWVNRMALLAAGVGPETPDPEGGRIGRDAAGDPDGLLFERAQDLIFGVVPPPSPAAVDAAARRAQAELHRYGVTAAHIPEGAMTLGALQRLEAAGDLRLRATTMLTYAGLDAALATGLRTGLGGDRLRLGPVKLFMDGSLGSETAAMLDPFDGSAASSPANRGLLTLGVDEVRDAVRRAAEGGLACAVHAIGDRANRVVLDAFQATRETWQPAGLRQRIEHAQVLHPDDLPRFAALGVIASMQPIHTTQDMELVDRLWGARGRYAYAFRSLLASGARLAFGSDAPVETPDPLAGVYAAVTRRRPAGGSSDGGSPGDGTPAGGWYPQERLSVTETVHAYTAAAAYTAGLEDRVGTLAPGMWADITCLSRDIFAGPAETIGDTILQTRVSHTIFDGAVVASSAVG